MKTALTTIAAVATLAVVGCGTTKPPQELSAARSSYQQAAQSPGASLASGELYEARNALQEAEKKFKDDPKAQETRDLAYVAQRKALAAQVKGDALVALDQTKQSQQQIAQLRQEAAAANRIALEQTKGALTSAQQQAESERRARIEADQRAQEAITKIQGIESRQSERGLVLTLSGSVLFATGKSVLLPTARERLAEVSKALQQDKRSITIVGHTDAKGSDESNQKLSEARANAVKNFLTQHGIDSSRVTSEGMGESQPIADNETPEGRANNRRVEIILENAGQGGGQQQGGSQQGGSPQQPQRPQDQGGSPTP